MILCKKYSVLLIKSLKNDSKIQDPRQLVWPNSCVLAEWVSPSHSGSFLWQVVSTDFGSTLPPPPFFYYENEG